MYTLEAADEGRWLSFVYTPIRAVGMPRKTPKNIVMAYDGTAGEPAESAKVRIAPRSLATAGAPPKRRDASLDGGAPRDLEMFRIVVATAERVFFPNISEHADGDRPRDAAPI